MSSQLISLLGWAFLPGLATGYLQTILYSVIIRAGDPKPAPGSKRWTQDRQRIHICVILFYLLYTVVDADYQLRTASDFYQNLGVAHDVDEKGLQSRFRRLTVQYHPDKATGPDKANIEAIYVQLKLARDTLVDPAKRFAYDRLGPNVLQWSHCKTVRDFIIRGVQMTSVYYAVTAAGLVLLGIVGYNETGRFWRYLTLAGLFTAELSLILQPTFPAILTSIINPVLMTTGLRSPYLPFQLITLLRKLAITFFIALSQLGPLLGRRSSAQGDAVSVQQLNQLDALTKAVDLEISRLTALELAPFAGQQSSLSNLRNTLKEWLVHNTVRSDPQVSAAMSQVLERRRAQVETQ